MNEVSVLVFGGSRKRCGVLAVIIGMLIGAQPGGAEPAVNQAVVRDLLQKLEERDRKLAERDEVINDLRTRVGQLEQRLDTLQPPQKPAGVPPRPPEAQSAANAAPKDKKPAPGTFEVDEEAAERALERTLTQVGALLLPYGQVEIQPFVTYVRRDTDFPGPVIFSAAEPLGLSGTRFNVSRNEFSTGITSRFGLPFHSQFELTVPARVVDQTTSLSGIAETSRTGASLGDIRVGLATTVLREQGWIPDIVARVTWDTDSGKIVDNGVNLFQGFNDIIGSVTVLKRQDPLVFTGTFSYQGSLEKNNVAPGNQFGLSIGAWLAASPETSLFMELQQTFADKTVVNGVGIPGSDQVSSTLVFGGSSLLGRGTLVSLSAGIGLTDDAPDYSVNLSVPIRFDLPFR